MEKLKNISLESKQLKYIEMGSSPMPIKHKEKLMQLLPDTKICMHYGSTEASRTCFIEFHQDKNYLNSVGKVTPGINLKIQVARSQTRQSKTPWEMS